MVKARAVQPKTRQRLAYLSALAVLLSASPALATSNPFTVYIDGRFGSTNNPPTGSASTAIFTISKTGNNAAVNILLKNTTVAPTQSTLVGLAFATPNNLTYTSYNSNGTVFTDVFTGSSAQINGDPFNNTTFDLCTRVTGGSNCSGGNPQAGLTRGQQASAPITFNFTDSQTNRTEQQLANDFANLYALTGGTTPSYQIAGRFQQVSNCTVSPCAGSDKVGGATGVNPPQGPTDAVPGPIPLFGAAAAFGYSRRLRRRISQSNLQSHTS